MIIKVYDEEYKLKFGINSFADTDLLDKVEVIRQRMVNATVEGNEEETGIDTTREFVQTLRTLVYIGCRKNNALLNEESAGDLIDDYLDTDEENSAVGLFVLILNELMTQGFIARLTPNLKEVDQAETTPKKRVSTTTKKAKN